MYTRDVRLYRGLGVAVVIPIMIFWGAVSVHAVTDTDGDGLSDADELGLYGTDPRQTDTDGDGYGDGVEIQNGYSPHAAGSVRLSDNDKDGDGLNDFLEILFKTDIADPDTDGDGYADGVELRNEYDPRYGGGARLEKRINVDLSDQHLEYGWGDVVLSEFTISSGRPGFDTPVGKFQVQDKLPTHLYQGATYYYPNTKWNLRFHGQAPKSYLIHGAYWHDDWGKRVSGGCVNVHYDNMEALYHWADVGTQIVITQ